ncbi:MAG: MarR family winged helix-turn-helix transcriptional regulator [Gemmatimonadales bacterium]
MKTSTRAAKERKDMVDAEPVTADLPTATAMKLWVVLSRAYLAVAEISKSDIERHDLTPAEFAILEALFHKGPMLLGEVQKKILVSSGGITFLVDRLTERGFVERLACPSDRRARYAALTKRGQKLMREVFPPHAAAIRDALAGLTRAEQRDLTGQLKQLGKEAARRAAGTPGCRAALQAPPA